MIKHIVLFRFRGELTPDQRREMAAEMRDIFQPLASLPSVNSYRVGINFSRSAAAWDVAVDSVFDSEGLLEEYRVSPAHMDAIARAARFGKDKCVVDYKF